MQIYKRFWYKKGEYRLKRPHGIPLNSFRSGDGWAWLSDHFEYIDLVKDQMYVLNLLEITFFRKKVKRKTAYTYQCEVAEREKSAKSTFFQKPQ